MSIGNKSITDWQKLENKVIELFQRCGCKAEKRRIPGPGDIQYEIDCLVTFETFGLPTKWLVECKDWQARVPQDVAASLRQRVTDTGADKGLLVCPAGFQKGTFSHAEISSIVLLTPDELEIALWEEFSKSIGQRLRERIDSLSEEITVYRLRLEDYLYANEKDKDIEKEHAAYKRLGKLRTALVAIMTHLQEWQVGRPSLGPPIRIPENEQKLEAKIDFQDDIEMILHVQDLLSQVRIKIDAENGLVKNIPPDTPRSPMAPPRYEAPRYIPTPPNFILNKR